MRATATKISVSVCVCVSSYIKDVVDLVSHLFGDQYNHISPRSPELNEKETKRIIPSNYIFAVHVQHGLI